MFQTLNFPAKLVIPGLFKSDSMINMAIQPFTLSQSHLILGSKSISCKIKKGCAILSLNENIMEGLK